MEKELTQFIRNNKISLFEPNTLNKESKEENIFKTNDAKSIYKKVITNICGNFCFDNTSNILKFFSITTNPETIKSRQEFFKTIPKNLDNSFLKQISKPKPFWKPKYDILVVTENESTFLLLKNLNCPVQYLTSPHDVSELEKYEIVQIIDCEEFERVLENLPQSIFLKSMDEVYLERYVEILSGWKKNIELLQKNAENLSPETNKIILEFSKLLCLLEDPQSKIITRAQAEDALEKINESISEKIKEITVSGDSLFKMLSKGKFSPEIEQIVEKEIEKTSFPEEIFTKSIPVQIDEPEFENITKRQSSDEFTNTALAIKKYSNELKELPKNLKELSNHLLILDFKAGISKFIKNSENFPTISAKMAMTNSQNLFLNQAQPITFHLDEKDKCSILTGANSGGKTTLLEHILQLISLFQIGLPVSGTLETPLFSEIYYFAKNKGAANKGAFENLLTQLSKIQPGKQTLILADEIESVTEPGVAGNIIKATAEYFASKGCYLVIATHLGKHINENLPQSSRIDGIEAKGLDETFNLIVNHNPVLGKLANSTPELIIERMSKSNKDIDFFKYLYESMKKEK